MKKIITLFASVMLFASAFAQFQSNKNYDDGKDVSYNNWNDRKDKDGKRDRYTSSERRRDMKIAEINREYNQKIESVKHRIFMSRSKKEAIICSLENQRRREIREVYERFNRRHDRGYDRDHDDHRNW